MCLDSVAQCGVMADSGDVRWCASEKGQYWMKPTAHESISPDPESQVGLLFFPRFLELEGPTCRDLELTDPSFRAPSLLCQDQNLTYIGRACWARQPWPATISPLGAIGASLVRHGLPRHQSLEPCGQSVSPLAAMHTFGHIFQLACP